MQQGTRMCNAVLDKDLTGGGGGDGGGGAGKL